MALDADNEARARPLERLDQVAGLAGGPPRRDEARGEVGGTDRLMVIRVDGNLRSAVRGHERRQPGVCGQPQRVETRRARAPAGTRVTGDVLEERPTGKHVDRLEASADAEDGQPPRFGGGPRRGLELIALRLDVDTAEVRGPVTGRVDVGSAAQQETVHRGECRRALGRA